MDKGRLIWVTGLPGAGKTTVGKELYQRRKAVRANVLWLDGDELRMIFDNHDYSPEARFAHGMTICRLCAYLVAQGIEVICCVVCMLEDYRRWNRENIPNYSEIYLRITDETLLKRNQKGLYGVEPVCHVVGRDIHAEEPTTPDLVFDNDGQCSPEKIAQEIDRYLSDVCQ